MKYGSVCSGIEAATVAWHQFGWMADWYSEIEKFPSAVLQHHYPEVPNKGDMTKFKEWGLSHGSIDLLVGGTPCQSFSVAGLRKGLDDPRGSLMLTFLAIASATRARWVVWENVPGVLSSNGGRDFGTFLGALGELGYGYAYRVLDAQYFGVAQRRRRVFVVGHLGDWRRAAAVLFERHSLSGNPAPSREAGQGIAGTLGARASSGGGFGTDFECAGGLQPCWGDGGHVSQTLDAVEPMHDVAPCLTKTDQHGVASSPIGWSEELNAITDLQPTIQRGGAGGRHEGVMTNMQVRRLTPVECERLQGFPDGWTDVPYRGKPAADGHRYKALGNSMAVPVMRWIGERIQMVDGIKENTFAVDAA